MAAPKGNQYSPGRLPEYDSDYHDEIARDLTLLGYNLKELADAMGLHLTTVKRWLKEHGSFRTSVYDGKALADAKVAAAFYRRATGFEYPAVKHLIVSDGAAVGSHIEEVHYTAVVLPDPSAALNWLKNRQPDQWRDKVDLALPPVINVTMNLDGDAPKPTDE